MRKARWIRAIREVVDLNTAQLAELSPFTLGWHPHGHFILDSGFCLLTTEQLP